MSRPRCGLSLLLPFERREGGRGGEAFSEREAERRDLPQLLEVVIHGISENVKGTAPLSLKNTLGCVWQALSAETRQECKVIHFNNSVFGAKSAFKSIKLPTPSYVFT